MFSSVLVAGRGEIARRVIRTLRRLGIRSIAVYTEVDAAAPHTREADVAVALGPASAYLDIDAVVAAVRATGAEAVHPGYGFLSENVDFARACAHAGIVFVGPGERALEVMGDKIRAKAQVTEFGVPTVPGFSAAGLDDAAIRVRADEVGYPLLVKPSAGGGGKGMQIVRDASELADALVGARRVASAAFGDDTLLVERLITKPRHIEIQVLADAHGHIVHLGERECTLQRRHQKVIEEAPSPLVDPALRARLGAAACAAAASVDYVGAGTVEFLVPGDRPDESFFIEMNTRLQVEHPVTELVTGIDLVEQQLRIATGAPLHLAQQDIGLSGHAVEARVYAESPERGFLPATGDIVLWRPSHRVRTDAGVETGSQVTADYDPMIAKVIAHADDRAGALDRLDQALAETVVLGVDTGIAFVRTLLADSRVRSGDLDTGFIDRLPPMPPAVASPAALEAAACVLSPPSGPAGVWGALGGWRIDGSIVAPVYLLRDDADQVHTVTGADRPGPDGPDTTQRAVAAADSVQTPVRVAADGAVWVHADGRAHRLRPLTRREVLSDRLAARGREPGVAGPELHAPMPGTVVAVHLDDGAAVRAGERVVTIEAMKMEHSVTAPHDGTVQLHVTPGAQVRRDELLAVVTGEESS